MMKEILSALAITVLHPLNAFAANMEGMDMGGSPADQVNMKAMQKMQQAMPKKGTGNPDKDFVAMMLPHHQGAVDMAKVELQYGKDPEMRKLATAIVKAQDEEIAQMNEWQRKHAEK